MNTSRSALLILDLQKEFLDPRFGRCLLPGASLDKNEQPDFLQNIELLLSRFRQLNGDIVWVRSLARGQRDFTDVRVEETILIVNSTSENPVHKEDTPLKSSGPTGTLYEDTSTSSVKKGSIPAAKLIDNGLNKLPLLTDAFLSIDTQHPPVSPESVGSEWAESAIDMMQCPPDWTVQKSWYSAFKDTTLLDQLRGRFVTQLYICGLMTNVGILATAADAARHGFDTRVLSDCVGYRSQTAHESALSLMEDAYGVEKVTSMSLLRASTRGKERKRGGATAMTAVGATAISRDELAALVEELKLNAPQDPLQPLENDEQSIHHKHSGRKQSPRSKPEPSDSFPTQYMTKHQELEDPQADHTHLTSSIRENSNNTVKTAVETNADNHEENNPDTLKMMTLQSYQEQSEGSDNPKKTITDMSKHGNPRKYDTTALILGADDHLGEGDSYIVNHLLPKHIADDIFEKIKNEVAWRSMFHRGGEVPRLVAVQGEIANDGSFPIYRHPADESPPLLQFSPTVDIIRRCVEGALGQKINHVLIQHYRHGNDYISEHSDKTIDIAQGSKIVNVSIGAQRTMCLRTKKDMLPKTVESGNTPKRQLQRIPMPHNSMFVLGLETNKRWLHGIKQDRRMSEIKSEEELSHNGERVSLTFRHITTYLSHDEKEIWGQGAVAKLQDDARPVVNGNSHMAEKLLEAFGKENHSSDFDWDDFYGSGFDVLHFQEPCPKLITKSSDCASTARVKICLHEMGIKFREEIISNNQLQSLRALSPRGCTPVIIDADPRRTTLHESLAILQYYENFHSQTPGSSSRLFPDSKETRSNYGIALNRMLETERTLQALIRGNQLDIAEELGVWNKYLQKTEYAWEDKFSLVDIALYPIMYEMTKVNSTLDTYPEIKRWMIKVVARESVKRTYRLGSIAQE